MEGRRAFLPGGRGPRPDTPPTSVLKATKDAAFTPLESTWINSRNAGNEFNKVISGLPTRVDLGDALNGKIDAISKEINDSGGVISADVLGKYQRELFGAARNDAQKRVAGQFSDAIDTALGPHAAAVDAANALAKKAKTGGEIDKWLTDVGSAPAAIAKRLEKKPAFYQGDVGDALREIGQRAAPPSLGRQVLNYGVDAATRSAIGAGGAYMFGENPYAGAATGLASKVFVPHLFNAAGNAPIRNALLAARHLNATGSEGRSRRLHEPLASGVRHAVAASGVRGGVGGRALRSWHPCHPNRPIHKGQGRRSPGRRWPK